MANLTEISIGVRKTALFVGFLLVTFIILRFIAGLAITYYRITHQPVPEAPNTAFDKIPKPNFVNNSDSSLRLTFVLQNIEGKPPETTPSGRVYTMPKKSYTFESGEEAKIFANSLGFEDDPKIDGVYYYYTHPDISNLNLFIDGTNLNFQLKYNYLDEISIFTVGLIKSEEEAVENAREFINFRNLFDDSIVNGIVITEPLTYDDRLKKFSPATSLSTAHAVRINYFRQDLDNLKILTDEFNKSFNYIIYMPVPDKQLNNILEISYYFWPIDTENFATYPLISGEEAYRALVNGAATIVNRGNNSDEITIRKIYLAYYDSSQPQQYLQTIFVFEGDNDFVAYYPAIRPEYLE